jgi:hypothetical protein
MRRITLFIIFLVLVTIGVAYGQTPNIAVDIDNYSWSNCPCTPTRYEFFVTNPGATVETYDLSVDTSASYYSISSRSIDIPARGKAPVYVFVNLPCEQTGSHTYHFMASARGSGYKSSTPFYLTIRESCYSYDLTLGNPYLVNQNRNATYKETRYKIWCVNDTLAIPVGVVNTGELKNSYSITTRGSLAPETVVRQLTSKNGTTIIFLVNLSEKGSRSVMIDALSDLGKVRKTLEIALNVNECVNGSVVLPATAPVRNLSRYLIGAIIVIAILLLALLVLLVLKRAKNTGKEKEAAGETDTRRKSPTAVVIMLFIVILAIAYLFVRLIWYLMHKLWPVVQSAASLLWQYWIGIAIAVVLLIVLIYLWRRERAFTTGKTLRHFVVVVCIAVLFLAAALCFYTELCRPIGVQMMNETVNVSNVSVINADSATTIIWNKNRDKTYDLREYVTDANDDTLTFTATPVNNITVTIGNDGTVLLRPEPGWSGERVVNFIADDGKGGRAYSPDITLVVLDQEDPFYGPVWNPLRNFVLENINYFLLALVFIVVLIIFLILQTKEQPKKVLVRRKRKA